MSTEIKAVIKNNSTKNKFIKNSLPFNSTKLFQEHNITKGIVNVVKTINKIETPSTAEVGST